MDINYLLRRQQMERSRAASATSHEARERHAQLADEYERLIRSATDGRISFVQPGGTAKLENRFSA
jgi:hypothetical protein